MKNIGKFSLVLVALAVGLTQKTVADEVLDWNAILRRSIVATPSAGGAPGFRLAAIVQASVFDAVNGIDRRFTPIHVTSQAPAGASLRAAAVQAAYTALTNLFPAQSAALDQDLATSLAGIAANTATETTASITSGRAWGEQVANEILAWRSTDGYDSSPSTYVGSQVPGKWRPTPPALANGAFRSLATTLPWVIPTPSSFRPPGPPDLTNAQYTADFIEEKAIGETNSTVRTPDQTQSARFWAGTALTFWNRAAASAAVQRHTTLSENARLFALLAVATADAAISCWDSKYTYEQWRPISAIRLASTDGNPDTVEQADWTPLIVTPPYPDYSSGHATVSGAAQAVLTSYFGNDVPVSGWSEGLGEATVRSWPNFSAAADEANLARLWAGIHWRHAIVDGRAAGNAVGAYVMANAAKKHTDIVLDWNATAEGALFVVAAGRPGPTAFLDMAILHAAVHDAAQSIDRRFEPYHVNIPGASGSPAAATAKAAHDVLANILPAQVADFDAAYIASLAKYGLATNDPGVAVGAQAAAGILALRANDGRVPNPLPPPVIGGTNAGDWRPSLPAFASMAAPWLGAVPPFTLNAGSQYRPQPPPALTSKRYAQDYEEVKALGRDVGSARTPEQTDLAYFYGGLSWHKTIRDIADAYVDNIGDRARLFALAYLSISDSFITAWDSKLFFNFWRPITAIREGDNDFNPETVGDPNWLPLFPTPPYPDYTSGFNNVGGSLTRTLEHFFGTDYMTFTLTSTHPQAIQKTRTLYRFSDLSDDAVDVRILQGIHFRAADEEAQKQGRSVADWAFGHYLRPLAEVNAQPEIVLQHTDGSLAFWTMTGTTIVDGIVSDTIPAGWQIVGAGDFNHDHQRDLVLQHTDGSVAFWFVQGTTITERIVLFAVPEDWRIVATGDFNNDNQVDLVLQSATGLISFWFMDGTSVTGTHLGEQLPAGWRVAGTGRFDNNAATDIVLQHTDGSVAFWLMDGTTILNGFVAYQIPPAWQIVATGNYNSDNDTDIVLQHTDGTVAFWLMDGTTITQAEAPYVLPTGWQIVAPR
jgi:hypothetical protein